MHKAWEDYEESSQRVVEVALDGKILRANRSFCELLGYSSEELSSLYVRDLTHPEDRAQSVSIVDWALSHQDQPLEVIKRYLRRDGKVLWCLLRTTLRRNLAQEPQTFLSFLDDFTDRLSAEPLLRALAHRVQMQSEHERLRISRELHDEVGQMLVALKQELAWLKDQVPPRSAARAARLSLVVDEIGASITRVWMGLRPLILDELGLIPAVDWLLQETCGKAQIAYEFQHSPRFPQLDSDTRIGLFRIAQEALSNVVRHSRAGNCKVMIHDAEAITRLEICDDGQGLALPELPSQGAGLLAMRERASLLGGSFDIEPLEPGTRVRVEVPHALAREKRPKVPPSWA